MLDRISAAFRHRRNLRLAQGLTALAGAVARRESRRLRVVDIGGTPGFWQTLDARVAADVVMVNIAPAPAPAPQGDPIAFQSVAGDARDLRRWADGAFDLVLSNSVIEHVGGWTDIERAAGEMRRLAGHGWVQTPAFGFPIEPHFALPFIHWLATPLRARLLPLVPRQGYGHLGAGSVGDARRAVEEINLLTAREIRHLFPQADLLHERAFGLTKSFIAAWPHGWWR
ncbi:MAG: methyltransferase domain-containing protein [Alphaproteobacteria bacterium]|nr:methyltransferase domain-containing protein [Alphaproteobacteria bacterium]